MYLFFLFKKIIRYLFAYSLIVLNYALFAERCDHYPWALKMFVGLLICTLLGLIGSVVASIIGCVGVRQGAGKVSTA